MKRLVGDFHFLHQKLVCGECHCLCICPLQLVGPASILFCLFFWPYHISCGILVPWPRTKPRSPAVKVNSPNHRTFREFRPYLFMSSCCCSVTQSCPTLCDPMDCSTPGFPVHHYLLEFAQTHVHWVDDAIQPSHPLLFPSPLAFNLSQHQGLFQWELALCIRWPKYRSCSFSISPSNEYSGLISFKIDWFDLLAVQGILKSLLQHHNLKASILWHSAFFMVQLSYPYMTTAITIALTRQTFVS